MPTIHGEQVMAGFMSYKACGFDIWFDPAINGEDRGMLIGRAYECRANYNPLIDPPVSSAGGTNARRPSFFDLEVSSNGADAGGRTQCHHPHPRSARQPNSH